ncbi:alpha/beta hydrolase family protein [Nocardia huaxiensis]|uniref:Hydrolase n=1 Tax=Nocardia huaxiensis TaxID=2755382 RepID=A0A7D6ZPX2_9NOCA|nr:hydrolase [Nocardia huaxiensis]QLY32463.1 hydrolase [Nocardia huaxiensis]UFS93830.1 hypothetical protein LPY97_23925 [Nocardia huaxiensis]
MIKRAAAAAVTAIALTTTAAGTAEAAPVGIVVLAKPGGQFQVGTTTLHLVDRNRPDPFQPDTARELMVSVFYPATDTEKYPRTRYLSNQFMPGLDQQLGIRLPGVFTNSATGAPVPAGASFPVVLYSPGAGDTRLWGNGLAEDLASRGYVVVTIDHTYEPAFVEFPGGRIVYRADAPNGFDTAIRGKYIDARLLDARFVLDSLTQLANGINPDAEQRSLPSGLDRALDLEHIGYAGHSSGGYTAVEAMHEDPRIDAAVDMDGQIGVDEDFGRVITEGTDRPVLLLTSQQIEEVGDGNPSFDAFWRSGTGWKQHVTMRDSAHYDFTDYPQLIPPAARGLASRYIGAIGDRGVTLVHTYVAAMFDKFLRGRTDTVLEQPPTEPELRRLR